MTGEDLVDENTDTDDATERDESAGVTKTSWRQTVGSSAVRSALTFGLAAVMALGVMCGWLGYRAYTARQAVDLRNLLVEAGRQEAINLTTIDFEHADADVQRVLDSATGEFYDEFSARSAPFVEVVKKARSKSVGTVTESGIESMSGQEGQVMVAVAVKTTVKDGPEDPPRHWRMRLTVTKQGSDAKVAKVEFVP